MSNSSRNFLKRESLSKILRDSGICSFRSVNRGYVLGYRLAKDGDIVVRIWHGREERGKLTWPAILAALESEPVGQNQAAA
jgi:hypothetical protein